MATGTGAPSLSQKYFSAFKLYHNYKNPTKKNRQAGGNTLIHRLFSGHCLFRYSSPVAFWPIYHAGQANYYRSRMSVFYIKQH
jgi:hypothetical protein